MKTIIAMCVCALLAACETTGDDDQPDAAPPVCKNAFDEACAATNGCGAAGAFCCYHFADDGAVTSTCLAPGTTCESDICVVQSR